MSPAYCDCCSRFSHSASFRARLLQAFLSLAFLSLLFACGDNGSSPAGSQPTGTGGNMPAPGGNPSPPPGGGSAPATPSKFVFGTVGFEPDGVDAGVIDRNTGDVSLVNGSPFRDGLAQANLMQILADPAGRFVFTLRVQAFSFGMPLGFPGICAFQVDSTTGALATAPNAPLIFTASEENFRNLAVDGRGRFLYQPSTTAFALFTIDQSSGAITKSANPGSAVPSGDFTLGSPDGNFVFNAGHGSLRSYAIDQQSGALSEIGTPVPIANDNTNLRIAMAVQRDGRVVYVASAGSLVMYDVASNGQLTPKNATPFSVPPKTYFLALTPDGKFLYAVTQDTRNGRVGNFIKGYAVDPSSSSIQPISGFAEVESPALAIDHAGKFVFVSDDLNRQLLTFSIDSGTGLWTQVATSTRPNTDLWTDLVTVP